MPELSLNKRQIKAALKNEEASARAAQLVHTSDQEPGIVREKKAGKFIYRINGKIITDTETLLRIKSLAIPPAWQKVWICTNPEGHLQATGYDKVNRKQYRYHPLWNEVRTHTKFFRLLNFGLKLPEIRRRIKNDLSKRNLTREKILAVVITILDTAFLRVGNAFYEKENGSYGLTTLKNKHVKIEGDKIKFRFIGKKGVKTNITLHNRRLSRVMERCKEIPGKQLFGYLDEEGQVNTIDSGMVNDYLREITGSEFTAKDFRTWAGTVSAIKALSQLGGFESQTEMKRKINQMFDSVATDLNNTRNVCRKYYVHPIVLKLYENGKLNRYFNSMPQDSENMKAEELVLIQILKNY